MGLELMTRWYPSYKEIILCPYCKRIMFMSMKSGNAVKHENKHFKKMPFFTRFFIKRGWYSMLKYDSIKEYKI